MFITFEGIDASGKTTQIKLIEDLFLKKNILFITTREPGGTQIGGLIRKILLNPDHDQMVPETEILLYLADRFQHVSQIIKPALQQNKVVLCDRYHDATIAYQGKGRGLNLTWMDPLVKQFLLKPELTLFFDISCEESQKRIEIRNKEQGVSHCRLENEEIEFFQKARTGYLEICAQEPERCHVIDAQRDVQTIQAEIVEILLSKVGQA